MKAPVYKPRPPRPRELEPYEPYLRDRIALYPGLSGKRLFREIAAMGFKGGYTTVTDFLRQCRPPRVVQFERRFETPAGRQAQVDFAQFKVAFSDEPGVTRIFWLFSMVRGHSRWLWGRFCPTQDLQTVIRCHIDAFDAMGGAPSEVLYDRMKTAVIDEDAEGIVMYNRSLVALLDHYGALPRACRPYRAKTKGKIERPYRYIRQDFFLGRTFRSADDLNLQFREWLDTVANVWLHATTQRIVSEHFAEEQPALTALPAAPHNAVLTIERRVSHEGMVSVGGNLYSVPDATRKRVVEVQSRSDTSRTESPLSWVSRSIDLMSFMSVRLGCFRLGITHSQLLRWGRHAKSAHSLTNCPDCPGLSEMPVRDFLKSLSGTYRNQCPELSETRRAGT